MPADLALTAEFSLLCDRTRDRRDREKAFVSAKGWIIVDAMWMAISRNCSTAKLTRIGTGIVYDGSTSFRRWKPHYAGTIPSNGASLELRSEPSNEYIIHFIYD